DLEAGFRKRCRFCPLEADGHEDQISRNCQALLDDLQTGTHHSTFVLLIGPLDPVESKEIDQTVVVGVDKRRCIDIELFNTTFFDSVGFPVNQGPLRPGIVSWSVSRSPEVNADLHNFFGTLAVGSGYAIRTGVAATKYDHVLTVRVDHRTDIFTGLPAVFLYQVVHRPKYPPQLSASDRDFARQLCADRQTDRVKFLPQFLERSVHPHVCVGTKNYSFSPQVIDAAGQL